MESPPKYDEATKIHSKNDPIINYISNMAVEKPEILNIPRYALDNC